MTPSIPRAGGCKKLDAWERDLGSSSTDNVQERREPVQNAGLEPPAFPPQQAGCRNKLDGPVAVLFW